MTNRFKFRVWAKPHEPTQTEGYYVDDADYMAMFPNGEVEIDYYVDNGYDGSVDSFEQDEIVIEQCTGLKDKNGKLIYEDDIVKTEWFSDTTIYQVTWDEKMACFCFDGKDMFYLFDDLPADVTEIIGNIHENPELLESEER